MFITWTFVNIYLLITFFFFRRFCHCTDFMTVRSSHYRSVRGWTSLIPQSMIHPPWIAKATNQTLDNRKRITWMVITYFLIRKKYLNIVFSNIHLRICSIILWNLNVCCRHCFKISQFFFSETCWSLSLWQWRIFIYTYLFIKAFHPHMGHN